MHDGGKLFGLSDHGMFVILMKEQWKGRGCRVPKGEGGRQAQ